VAAKVYHKFLEQLLKGNVGDMSAGGTAVKAILLSTAYSFNIDHAFVSDIVASEVSGTGYVAGYAGAGRVALASKAVTRDTTNDLVYFDADDVSWAGLNLGATQIGSIVLWLPKTNDADSPVICFDDTGGFPITTTGGTYLHSWPSAGIFKLVP
jgi:hypothetical protein